MAAILVLFGSVAIEENHVVVGPAHLNAAPRRIGIRFGTRKSSRRDTGLLLQKIDVGELQNYLQPLFSTRF